MLDDAPAHYTYQRYLSSKKSVDDRALNAHVLHTLADSLPTDRPLRVLEVGGGVGTMIARLVERGLVKRGQYTLVDVDEASLQHAPGWLCNWANQRGLNSRVEAERVHLAGNGIELEVRTLHARVEDLPSLQLPPADLLVANALLDLLDVPNVLPRMVQAVAPGGLCWLTVNFDGESIFEPAHPSDGVLLEAYHQSMDDRTRDGAPAGDRHCGRHLFGHLRDAGGQTLAAGASDWVVFAGPDGYPEDEAYFLHHILYTVEQELMGRHGLPEEQVRDWVTARRNQVARGELTYVAKQLDLLARRP